MATRVAVPNIFRWMRLSQDPGAPPSDPVDTWSNMIWNPHWFLLWDLFDLSLLFFSDKAKNYFCQLCKENQARGPKCFPEVKILDSHFQTKTCGVVAVHQSFNCLYQRHVVLFSSCTKEAPGCWVALASRMVSIWAWDASMLLSAQTSSLHDVTSQHSMSFKSADKVVALTERLEAFIQAKEKPPSK